ncbi:MAG: hypothetical protein HZC55_12820 [Verrucomicrobia bacterium]|jgi:hypothetical protein|nr:hypothetical protein [Verrucomicrobiota bacterium]
MNNSLHDPRHPWFRLVAAARTVRDDRTEGAPYGFATRVAALALAPERAVRSLFEVFALRALVIASLLAVCSIAINYNEISRRLAGGADDLLLADDDTVVAVLALAD